MTARWKAEAVVPNLQGGGINDPAKSRVALDKASEWDLHSAFLFIQTDVISRTCCPPLPSTRPNGSDRGEEAFQGRQEEGAVSKEPGDKDEAES